ncbi:histidine phosphatase family protein [Desertimonas flava]|uniref:histidine phosphatase family protein n=1 Tax=Desertimonas flava TaxID=2064846 RepID=UPI000E350C87|nr:histidine phosphatase family protein [Desertimonas flava]
MTELVLMRHAQPEWVKDERAIVNPPLTELGQTQAGRLAKALVDERFDEIFVSPMQRARQTAAPILEVLGRDEVVEPWLEEIRDPDWHGVPADRAAKAFKELRERPAEAIWDGLDGGEAMSEFVARVRDGATAFLAERGIRPVPGELPVWEIDDPQRRIGLVAHAGTNSVVTCHLLGLSPTPWEWDRLVMRHASISRLVALPIGNGYVFSLTSLSDVEHLDPDQRTV